MNEAARAALDACGGYLKQNPLHLQDSSIDKFVPAKRGDGEAVDHTDLQASNFGHERDFAAESLEEERYSHVDFVIDMVSIPLQGNAHPHCDSTSSILEDVHTMAVRFHPRSRCIFLVWYDSVDGFVMHLVES